MLLHNIQRHADNNSRRIIVEDIHMMSHAFMRVTRGVIAGLVVGSVIGAVVASVMRPKKSCFKRNAGRALEALGNMIQNFSDWMF